MELAVSHQLSAISAPLKLPFWESLPCAAGNLGRFYKHRTQGPGTEIKISFRQVSEVSLLALGIHVNS